MTRQNSDQTDQSRARYDEALAKVQARYPHLTGTQQETKARRVAALLNYCAAPVAWTA